MHNSHTIMHNPYSQFHFYTCVLEPLGPLYNLYSYLKKKNPRNISIFNGRVAFKVQQVQNARDPGKIFVGNGTYYGFFRD